MTRVSTAEIKRVNILKIFSSITLSSLCVVSVSLVYAVTLSMFHCFPTFLYKASLHQDYTRVCRNEQMLYFVSNIF